MNRTQVADVRPLASLTGLQSLDLGGTHVADVTPLAKLTGLRSMYLSRTQVSQESSAKLRRALPSLVTLR